MTDSFTETLDCSTLKSAAETARQIELDEHPLERRWPGCFDTSQQIIDQLVQEYSVPLQTLSVAEFTINSGYKHYTVEVSPPTTSQTTIIDATYDQFGTETDTPISVAPSNKIQPVVVCAPAETYYFSDYRTN